MEHSPPSDSQAANAPDRPIGPHPPAISLPKGGGAVRGIGEKFTSNPVTGTGALSVPIATSAGRAGFGPGLALAYDSGAGNGPFGLGWSLQLPAITRKTDKGLPRYDDAAESDVFVLAGSEDLVPVLRQDAGGNLLRGAGGAPLHHEETRDGHLVRRYRPRVEGLFARIERWRRLADGDTHWRSISQDNVLTVYGATGESRIADPADPRRVFSWLVCQRYDDKGNAIAYDHVAENADQVDLSLSSERNRERGANRYLKRIRYGNRQPLLVDPARPSFRRAHLPVPDLDGADWMFEVVFDYGEGDYREQPPDPDGRIYASAHTGTGAWPVRIDPFSSHRSGFEVRSYRLCRRILMLHHFAQELGVAGYLVGATELGYLEQPGGAVLAQVVKAGFKRVGERYLKGALPPLEFTYSVSPLEAQTHDQLPLQELDRASLHNLPSGIDGGAYRWVDLHGEGIPGVLAEQGDAWYYKRNLGEGRFAPARALPLLPSLAALGRGRQQLLDLAGGGALALADFTGPAPGFFERDGDGGWHGLRTFADLPQIDWQDKNLRFVDLTGDGLADVLVTEELVYTTWHESRGRHGFGPARHTPLPLDEEDGPRLVFADGAMSIYLADMSGDGLSDLVRINQGGVCYWPNRGYGRFGSKVTFDHAGWFDDLASFDQRRIRLADTDGSGPTDILYLGRDGVRVYLNEQGNSLSAPRLLQRLPPTDDTTFVEVVDFFGRGTACLLWSSPLPGAARSPLRVLDLMGGIKPRLLTAIRNNLGAETRIEYASSTEFYLADQAAGTPWITRLPFPVHAVARVEVNDLISGARFVKRHAYHHGYFDPEEREFRGFGRVDVWDSEEFGVLGGPAFHVPPTLTKTWFHTGAYLGAERIARLMEGEYYREEGQGQAAALLDDTVLPPGLEPGAAREAVRSLKGAMLREELYALDATPAAGRPYAVAERNYMIRQLQPRGSNRHAIFFTHALESVDLHYERKLYPVLRSQIVDLAAAHGAGVAWRADPRVTHGANLDVDDYGNVRQSVAIAYGRRFDDGDPLLQPADRLRQKQLLATCTESRFTNPVAAADAWVTPRSAEVRTWELRKLPPPGGAPGSTALLRLAELRTLLAQAGDGAHDLPYEDVDGAGATGNGPWRRPVEQQRSLYRSNDLSRLLPLGALESGAVPGAHYRLALTAGLLAAVVRRDGAALLPDPVSVLAADALHVADRGGYVDLDGDGHWWVPSGRVYFAPDPAADPALELAQALREFFMPRRFRTGFGHDTVVDYAHALLPVRSVDAAGNSVQADYDWRVLQPQRLTDPNGNLSSAAFDALGAPVAIAAAGKAGEALGDTLDGFGDLDADPSLAQLQALVADPAGQVAPLLKGASSRLVYDLDRFRRCGQPALAVALARETHAADPPPAGGLRIQAGFEYSDGFGRQLQSKLQAEPGRAPLRAAPVALPGGDIGPGPLQREPGAAPRTAVVAPRWVGSGRTVYNNRGKPVKQYEPFFSSTPLYEPEPDMAETGVSPVLYYDPVERVVATLHPNHTYEKVAYGPWRQESWDVNDTVLQSDPRADPDVGDFFLGLADAEYLPSWHDQRRNGQMGPAEQAAASKAAAHAATPAVTHFDPLGRAIVGLADSGKDGSGAPRRFATRTSVDIEGNGREVRDANDRSAVRRAYDMLGRLLAQSSMEAGQRWIVSDIDGKPIRSWDSRGHSHRLEYDRLRRPTYSFVTGADPAAPARELAFERIVYGDADASGLSPAEMTQRNLRGRPYQHYDGAGVVTAQQHDFKGNVLRRTQQLLQDYQVQPDWAGQAPPALDDEVFSNATRYDALNRVVQAIAPHSSRPGAGMNVIQPVFNEANLLERVDVWLDLAAEPGTLQDPQTAGLHAVASIDYDAKGRRTRIEYGNGVATDYAYDPRTLRLTRLASTRAGAALQDLSYVYDPAGNPVRLRDDAQQTIFFDGQAVAPQCDYTYDALYRLVAATGREHIGQLASPQTTWNDALRCNLAQPGDGQAMRNYTELYRYDPAGNIEQLVHQAANANWTRSYAYGEASLLEPARNSNRLSSTQVGGTLEAYRYDAHGNMTAMPHLTRMDRDFKDQLAATARQAVAAGQDAETCFYRYGGDGQRVRKIVLQANGARRERIYLGGMELYREYASDGTRTLERETLHVMDGEQRVALVESRTAGTDAGPARLVRYQLGTHLRSASLELDAQGKLISYEEYYPYGSTSFQSVDQALRSAAKRYRYTAKERDEESGLAYHGARYYAPWLGRWTAADPIGTKGDINLYAYVQGRVTVAADPTGHVIWFLVAAIVVLSTVTAVSEAGAPANEAEARAVKPRIGELEFAAHVAVTGISIAAGGAVARVLKVAAPVTRVAASGYVGGFVQGTGELAIQDVKRGEASSAGTYLSTGHETGKMGAVAAVVLHGAGALVKKAAPLVTPKAPVSAAGDAPHVGAGGDVPKPKVKLSVADAGKDKCVGNVCAIMKNAELGAGPESGYTVKELEKELGFSFGRTRSGLPNPKVATPEAAVGTIEAATGLKVVNPKPVNFGTAAAEGQYAVFVGDGHVVYARIKPGGQVSVLDPNVGRGWGSWNDFLKYAERNPTLYGPDPARLNKAFLFK